MNSVNGVNGVDSSWPDGGVEVAEGGPKDYSVNEAHVDAVAETPQDYHNLRVWKSAMELVDEVYRMTANFPLGERYGLTDQMRRAAVSVPSNIAEGSARSSSREFGHFLDIASGSLAELETQALISRNLGLLAPESADTLVLDIRRIAQGVRALRDRVRRSNLP